MSKFHKSCVGGNNYGPKVPLLQNLIKLFSKSPVEKYIFSPNFSSFPGMVLPKCWLGLAWVVAFYGCVAQTQALLSEDELIR